MYGNNVVVQAENAAKAQGAAFAAMKVLENKKTSFNVDAANTYSSKLSTSSLIRVTNAVTPYMAEHLSQEEWNDYHEDLIEGFSRFGKIVHSWFVKKDEKKICADPGNIFIEYENPENSEAAFSEMNNRMYDEREIKLFYIPRTLYYQNFQKGTTPPEVPQKGKEI